MSTALQVIQIIFYSVGTLFLISFMIIGIWSFVLLNKAYKVQRIKNLLLDSLNKNIAKLNLTNKSNDEINTSIDPNNFLSDLGFDDDFNDDAENAINDHVEYND